MKYTPSARINLSGLSIKCLQWLRLSGVKNLKELRLSGVWSFLKHNLFPGKYLDIRWSLGFCYGAVALVQCILLCGKNTNSCDGSEGGGNIIVGIGDSPAGEVENSRNSLTLS